MISHVFDPLTHPSTHQKNTHPWVRNSPQIPNLQMESKYLDSFKSYRVFTDLEGTPLGVGGCVGGGGVGWVCGWGWGWVGAPPTHVHTRMCTHACAHMCTHTCMHVKHDKHGCLHGGGHLQFPNMFIFAFHACAFMHMSRDTPHAPRCSPTHLPPPQSRREPQGAQITKSL